MSNTGKNVSCRPLTHLIAVGNQYPTAWREFDFFRADRSGLPSWPDWCFLPLAASYAVISGGGSNRVPFHRIGDVARLGAIAAWRVTQGIYRYDKTLFESIVSTPVEGDLSCELLQYLPEWCVYIETPELQYMGTALHGFFAHLEFDSNTNGTELRLLLDIDEGLCAIPIHLGPWSLAEALARMAEQSAKNLAGAHPGVEPLLLDSVASSRPFVEPLVSLLLYLCSQNSEIGGDSRRPINPNPKKTKNGPRLFSPDRHTVWDVGVRLGTAIRRAQSKVDSDDDGSHAAPRPHIRRAHWHGFRSGPCKLVDGTTIPTEKRKFDLRWLPPIMVNVDSVDDLPATIRPINSIL